MDNQSEIFLSNRVGMLEMKRGQLTTFSTCILFNGLFALMPASLMKELNKKMCTFIESRNGTEQRIQPIEVLTSSKSLLSLLLFNNSQKILKTVQGLYVELGNMISFSIHLFGQQIQSNTINNKLSCINNQKTVKVEYLQRIDNVIYYNCNENKNGFIGAAIRLDDDLTYVGIHQGGKFQFSYGILFTKETINELTAMFRNYIHPKSTILYPDQYKVNDSDEYISEVEAMFKELQIQIPNIEEQENQSNVSLLTGAKYSNQEYILQYQVFYNQNI